MKKDRVSSVRVRRFADMFSAMGAEPRLKIVRLLLSAHPGALTVTEIQSALDIPNSTLSHHLDRLKQEDLVTVQRDGTFLWYSANSKVLEQLLTFFYSECLPLGPKLHKAQPSGC
jgi:DNA-binding transcriptional ArsR family regulator